MDLSLLIMVFIISLFLGSFYNVVGLRALNKENMITGRSHCVSCGHDLSFLDMLPLFSYIFLAGKCRYCGKKISSIYPFGELLTAVSYTLIINKFGFTLEAFIQLVFITVMIIGTVTDLKETIVPDSIIIIGLVLLILLRFIFKLNPLNYLISGLASFTVLYLIFIFSGGKMGGADVKIYSLVGLSIGFINAMSSLFYASIVALFVSLLKLLGGKKIKGVEIPFVPFITIGVLISYYIDIYVILNIV